MRVPHIKMYQSLCGLFVALALVVLPLPALADTSDSTPDNQQTQTAPVPNDSPSTTQPTLGIVTPDAVVPLLQSAPDTSAAAISLPAATPTTANDTNVAINHDINSDATSGSAAITNNSQAGNATSGNAAASATILNVANANGLTAGNFTTFECDVRGDVQDNLVIDPTSLLPICKTTTVGTSSQAQAGSSQSLQTGASLVDILNNIVLSANSGDATVAENSVAGNATSGDALAMANIVNIANSAIGAKNSFLGIINIYGSLKGDILVPQSLVDSLIGPTGASAIATGNTTTNITNTIDASATSGEATVAGNSVGGSATSGDAMTSLTVLNLTGKEVVAKNSLLVFVNVLGKWMGLIVPAPGSNTALLGGDVKTSGNPASSGALTGAGDTTTNITNIVTVQAASGDANVTNNTEAGNAISGTAKAGVNILNITNSNFLLDDWFGALFINVLGSWLGDFNIQAAALPAPETPAASQPIQDVQVYQFVEPTTVEPTTTPVSNRNGTDITAVSTPTGTVLSSSTSRQQVVEGDQAVKAVKLDLLALGAIVIALTLLIATGTMVIRRWHTA